MKCLNVYENSTMHEITGEALRPGGFRLTERALKFCEFSTEDAVLDLGCGRGATVGYLYEKHNIKAVGIDISEKLLDIAKLKHPYADFILGTGEKIPFSDDAFNVVFAECTLSLMEDINSIIKEVDRVLKVGGWFIIMDVYAKNPSNLKEIETFSLNSCMRGLHDLNLLKEKLKSLGFNIIFLEDCSDLLKELMVKIIFSYGSMGSFWNKTTDQCIDGDGFHEILKVLRPGYFMMIGRKRGDGA